MNGDKVSDSGTAHRVKKGTTLAFNINLSDGSTKDGVFGKNKPLPIAADYTGDGIVDLATLEKGSGGLYPWRIQRSDNGAEELLSIPLRGDLLIAGCDMTGDGADDIVTILRAQPHPFAAVFSSKNGQLVRTAIELLNPAPFKEIRHGTCADLNGDGKDEIVLLTRVSAPTAKNKSAYKDIIQAFNRDGSSSLYFPVQGRADELVPVQISMTDSPLVGYFARSGTDGLIRNLSFVVTGTPDTKVVKLPIPASKDLTAGTFASNVKDLNSRYPGMLFITKNGKSSRINLLSVESGYSPGPLLTTATSRELKDTELFLLKTPTTYLMRTIKQLTK